MTPKTRVLKSGFVIHSRNHSHNPKETVHKRAFKSVLSYKASIMPFPKI